MRRKTVTFEIECKGFISSLFFGIQVQLEYSAFFYMLKPIRLN